MQRQFKRGDIVQFEKQGFFINLKVKLVDKLGASLYQCVCQNPGRFNDEIFILDSDELSTGILIDASTVDFNLRRKV